MESFDLLAYSLQCLLIREGQFILIYPLYIFVNDGLLNNVFYIYRISEVPLRDCCPRSESPFARLGLPFWVFNAETSSYISLADGPDFRD